MTATDVSPLRPRHLGGRLLTLLLATAALATGAQALAPAPAAAMVNEGEECDPLMTIDCEPTNGGGGGPVGTTTGGGASGDEIIGEPIYVEGHLPPPPSPCRASSCLPSQIGGGSTGFLDRGGRSARPPHPRGRATRVGEVAKGKAKAPTKPECERLKIGRLELPADLEMKGIEARMTSTRDRWTDQEQALGPLEEEAKRLDREVMSLQNSQAPSRKVFEAKERHQRAVGAVSAKEGEIRITMDEFFRLAREHEAWLGKRGAEARILLKRCAATYGTS